MARNRAVRLDFHPAVLVQGNADPLGQRVGLHAGGPEDAVRRNTVGAFHVADAAESLESRMQNGDDPSAALAALADAVAQVRTAIDAILRRS